MAGIIFSKNSNVNNSIYGKSQEPIRLFLEKRAEAFEQQSIIKEVFKMETSDNFGEKFGSLTGMDEFEPTEENGAYPLGGMQEGYSKFLEHVTWKKAFSISQEMIEDAKILDMRKQPAAFMAAYYRTRERFGAFVLGGATKGLSDDYFGGKKFNLTGADGQPLFSKTHPSALGKGNQTNCFSNEFSNAVLGKIETEMQNVKGDNGETLDVSPDTIIIPNDFELKYAVLEAIGADRDPDSANNGFNMNFGRWNLIVWPYLNDFIDGEHVPFIIMDKRYNETYDSAVWLDRIKLAVKSSIDENTDANVWRGRSRFVAGFNDWRAFAVGGVPGGTEL